MDYIPVYEGEDSDDGSVKLSPGKLQRTGVQVRAGGAARHPQPRSARRAPSSSTSAASPSIAMRSESFIQKVANVTTGSARRQGPAPDGGLQPGDRVGRGRIPLDDQLQGHRRRRCLWQGLAAAADESRRAGGGDRGDREEPRRCRIAIDWTAPRDGIVLERNVIDGMRAQPGDVLFRIADHSHALGARSTSPNATWRDAGGRAAGDRAGARLSRPRRSPGRSRDLSADQQGRRARRACASSLPIPIWCCCPTCMSMSRSTPAVADAGACRAGQRRDRHRQRARS